MKILIMFNQKTVCHDRQYKAIVLTLYVSYTLGNVKIATTAETKECMWFNRGSTLGTLEAYVKQYAPLI